MDDQILIFEGYEFCWRKLAATARGNLYDLVITITFIRIFINRLGSKIDLPLFSIEVWQKTTEGTLLE